MRLLGVATETEEADEIVGLGAPLPLAGERTGQEQRGGEEAGPPTRLQRHLDRLPHGELGEEQRGLERAPETQAAPGALHRSTRRRPRGFAPCLRQGTKPPIAFISVDLPAPLVPMRPTISSSPTRSEASSTATTPPKRTLMPDTSSAGTSSTHRRSRRTDEHRERRRRAFGRRRFAFRCRPREQGVARRVRDLHQPTGEVEQQDEQAEARGQQGHERVVGEEGGEPDDPQRAEHGAHGRRDAADHDQRHERERVGHQEVALGERHRLNRSGEEGPTEPGDESRDRERAQLRRCDTDGVRRGAVGVVAHRDGGAPDPRSTQPTDHDEGHHEHGEAHVVVRPLRRQVEAEQRPARERNRREIVGQHRLAEQVLRRGDRKGERADREEQAAHAQSAYADQRREAGGNERSDHDGEQERQSARDRGAARPDRGSCLASGPPRPGRQTPRRPSGRATAGPPTR